MKRINDFAIAILIVFIMVHLYFGISIASLWFEEESIVIKIVVTSIISLIIILLNIIMIKLRYLWHFTRCNEEGIKQTFLTSKKEITYKRVKYIYLMGNFAVLTLKKELDLNGEGYNFKQTRVFREKLKNNIFIYLGGIGRYSYSNEKILLVILSKCVNAEIIQVGELPTYIKNFLESYVKSNSD